MKLLEMWLPNENDIKILEADFSSRNIDYEKTYLELGRLLDSFINKSPVEQFNDEFLVKFISLLSEKYDFIRVERGKNRHFPLSINKIFEARMHCISKMSSEKFIKSNEEAIFDGFWIILILELRKKLKDELIQNVLEGSVFIERNMKFKDWYMMFYLKTLNFNEYWEQYKNILYMSYDDQFDIDMKKCDDLKRYDIKEEYIQEFDENFRFSASRCAYIKKDGLIFCPLRAFSRQYIFPYMKNVISNLEEHANDFISRVWTRGMENAIYHKVKKRANNYEFNILTEESLKKRENILGNGYTQKGLTNKKGSKVTPDLIIDSKKGPYVFDIKCVSVNNKYVNLDEMFEKIISSHINSIHKLIEIIEDYKYGEKKHWRRIKYYLCNDITSVSNIFDDVFLEKLRTNFFEEKKYDIPKWFSLHFISFDKMCYWLNEKTIDVNAIDNNYQADYKDSDSSEISQILSSKH